MKSCIRLVCICTVRIWSHDIKGLTNRSKCMYVWIYRSEQKCMWVYGNKYKWTQVYMKYGAKLFTCIIATNGHSCGITCTHVTVVELCIKFWWSFYEYKWWKWTSYLTNSCVTHKYSVASIQNLSLNCQCHRKHVTKFS